MRSPVPAQGRRQFPRVSEISKKPHRLRWGFSSAECKPGQVQSQSTKIFCVGHTQVFSTRKQSCRRRQESSAFATEGVMAVDDTANSNATMDFFRSSRIGSTPKRFNLRRNSILEIALDKRSLKCKSWPVFMNWLQISRQRQPTACTLRHWACCHPFISQALSARWCAHGRLEREAENGNRFRLFSRSKYMI